MRGFLTDFWRDVIEVVSLALALVPVALAVLERASIATAPTKFSLFEKSPVRRAKIRITEEQMFSLKILAGSVVVTIVGSYFWPMVDNPSASEPILKPLIVLLAGGGALLQVGLIFAFALGLLIQKYPKLELWFSDTTEGNASACVLCFFLLLVSFKVMDASVVDPMPRASFLIAAYSASVYFFAFARLLLGVVLAVEHAAPIIKKMRR
jgi:hypothetical protein